MFARLNYISPNPSNPPIPPLLKGGKGGFPKEATLKTEKKTFIVSVYRSDDNDPERLIGTVEDAGTENERWVFHTVYEMVSIISGKERNGRKKGKKGRKNEYNVRTKNGIKK